MLGYGQTFLLDLHGYGSLLFDGAWLTVKVALASVGVGLIFGLLGAWAKFSKLLIVRLAADTYTTIIRGVPELLLLLIIFYGGTVLLQEIWALMGRDEYVEVQAFAAGTFTLGFVFGAYATEVFRGATLAVPKGQIEAAYAIGMSRFLVSRRILLPQMWRYALPALVICGWYCSRTLR